LLSLVNLTIWLGQTVGSWYLTPRFSWRLLATIG
jgi:hypothetical protein